MTVDDWASGATIEGVAVPGVPDLARMRTERHQRLQGQLEAQGLDGLVLLGSSGVAYATGAEIPGDDPGRASLFRPVAVVIKGDPVPHLYTAFADGAPADLPADHLHGPLFPDLEDGIDLFEKALAEHFSSGASVGVDDETQAMLGHVRTVEWVDAGSVMGPVKLAKSPDEVACLRQAQHINELAMIDAQAILRPGVRQSDLSGAFLRRLFELGASAGSVDPIWQVMAPTRELGRGPSTATSPFRRRRPTVFCGKATSSGSMPASCGRAMPRTTGGHGSRAPVPNPPSTKPASSGGGEPWSTRPSRS